MSRKNTLKECDIEAELLREMSSSDEKCGFENVIQMDEDMLNLDITNMRLNMIQLIPDEVCVAEDVSLAAQEVESLLPSRPSYSILMNKNREWSTNIENVCFTRQFNSSLNPTRSHSNRSQPIDYFYDLLPKESIRMIVTNTNIYAKQKKKQKWKDVTEEEMLAYLGVIIMMSINPMSDSQLYWSTDEFYKHPVISRIMPLKRFKKITQNIHISDIRTELLPNSPNYDKLSKVRPLINTLNNTFSAACAPSQTHSVDEAMIKFKGKSGIKQYMPKKPIKRGYKCWARCESKTGYLYQFQIYTGRNGPLSEVNLGYRVVMDLCEQLPKNSLVAFDNFFTSLPLLEALYEKKIYCVGTIRSNRKGLPYPIISKHKDNKLETGEYVFQYSHPVSALKWRDTKDVYVCTTAFNPKDVAIVNRSQKDGTKKQIFCPLPIKKYTEYMGGVDIFDHYRSSYPLGKKSRKNWHRIFWFLLEACVVNSYILYINSHSVKRNIHRDFRLRIARSLVGNFTSRKKSSCVFKTKKGGQYGVPDEIRLQGVGYHMPVLKKFRRCRFCSTRAKERRSKYACKECGVSLCAAPCFDNFHLPNMNGAQ